MPPSADSTVPYAGPTLRGWDVLYEERFALARSAVQDGDLGMLAAMRARDRLGEVDFAAALRTESLVAALTTVHVTDGIRALAEKVYDYNASVKIAVEKMWQTTYRLLCGARGLGRDEWQKHVDEAMDRLKATTANGMEALRESGKMRVQELPPQLRPLAAQVFAQGLQSVLGFFAKAMAWLCKARVPTTQWFKDVSHHVELWIEELVGWFFMARKEIEEWFKAADVTLQQRRCISMMRSLTVRED